MSNQKPNPSPSHKIAGDDPDRLFIEAMPSGRGDTADIRCTFGGSVIHRDRLNPATADRRRKFAAAVCKAIGDDCPLNPLDIEHELIAVAERIDREREAAAETVDAATLDELDASRIRRPDLIIEPELSALSIPTLLERGHEPVGVWQLYIRDAAGRRSEMLADRLTMPGGQVWLRPQPAEPSVNDVNERNRWSLENRRGWLKGEPTPTTADVLRLVAELVDRFIVLPDDETNAAAGHGLTLAAWVLMTYVYPALPAVPYVYLTGPPGSGKSTTMDVLKRLVWRPLSTSNTTAATIFRSRHAYGGTLLMDEAERLKENTPDVAELRSILLAGYKRGNQSTRLEPIGDTFRPQSFDVFGPTALACVRGLPAALLTRAIPVRMVRAAAGDSRTERSMDAPVEVAQFGNARDALHRWALDYGAAAIATPPPASEKIANRDAELWHPLLAIVATADADAATLLLRHAEQTAAAVAEDAEPWADPSLLFALLQLRSEGEMPQAGEVLERAKAIDAESFDDDWTARRVSSILKRYAFATEKTNGKRIYRTSAAAVRNVIDRYGFGDNAGGTA